MYHENERIVSQYRRSSSLCGPLINVNHLFGIVCLNTAEAVASVVFRWPIPLLPDSSLNTAEAVASVVTISVPFALWRNRSQYRRSSSLCGLLQRCNVDVVRWHQPLRLNTAEAVASVVIVRGLPVLMEKSMSQYRRSSSLCGHKYIIYIKFWIYRLNTAEAVASVVNFRYINHVVESLNTAEAVASVVKRRCQGIPFLRVSIPPKQ